MVNTTRNVRAHELRGAAKLIAVYVLCVIATIVTLAVLSRSDPDQATSDAWVHAVIVGVFAVLLPVRLRAARRGSERAGVAVGIIAAVLVVVNVVEASIPGLFPVWMRVEMAGIAVLMTAVAVLVLRTPR